VDFGLTQQLSFHSIWQFVRIVALIQVFNAAIGYFAWLAYGYAVSAETIVALSVGYTFLILAIKKAHESEANAEPTK
jgi:hypothetical protein